MPWPKYQPFPQSPPELRPRGLYRISGESRAEIILDVMGASVTMNTVVFGPQRAFTRTVIVSLIVGAALGSAGPAIIIANWWRELGPLYSAVVPAFLVFCYLLVLVMLRSMDEAARFESRKRPLFIIDRQAGTLQAPRIDASWPLDRIVALQVINGQVRAKNPDGRRVIDKHYHQLAIIYRTDEGSLRRRMVGQLLPASPPPSPPLIERLAQLVNHAPFPIHYDRTSGMVENVAATYVREPLSSQAFDLDLDSPPVVA